MSSRLIKIRGVYGKTETDLKNSAFLEGKVLQLTEYRVSALCSQVLGVRKSLNVVFLGVRYV